MTRPRSSNGRSPSGRPAAQKGPPDLGQRPPLAIELFSGTAGATAAFRGRGWDVITVDNDARHKPTVVADVREFVYQWPAFRSRAGVRVEPFGPNARPVDLLWMSPPCTEFSDANPNKPLWPSLELYVACLEAVRRWRPRYWLIENVRGAIPFFGTPAQKIGPWCLWGYFPLIDVTLEMHDHRKSARSTAVARAAVPRGLSEALYRAVTRAAAVPGSALLDLRPFRRHRHIRKTAAEIAGGFPTEDLFA